MEIYNAIGRRKAAVARVYLQVGKGEIIINNTKYDAYFPQVHLKETVTEPFKVLEQTGNFDVKASVSGGGIKGQAEAVRLGIARALIKSDPEFRPSLKKAGFLTRDARVVERKKPGLKKARKKTQFSKR